MPAVLKQFSVIMFSRQFQWKCFLEQEGDPSARGWISVTRYKLVASAHFWVQGDKEQGHKGENASVPSVLQIGHKRAPGPGECAHQHQLELQVVPCGPGAVRQGTREGST